MKNNLFRSCIYAAALSVFYACSPDEQVVTDLNKISKSEQAMMCDELTFDNQVTRTNGFITAANSTGGMIIGVSAFQRPYSGANNYSEDNPGQWSANNRANLFDTSSPAIPPSDDDDLDDEPDDDANKEDSGTGNALIINHNDNASVPDDWAWGGTLNLYFTAAGSDGVTLNNMNYMDNEEGLIIKLYGSMDNSELLNTIIVPGLGDAGDGQSQLISLENTSGVVRMEIIQGQDAIAPNVPNGSGAVDNINFCYEVPEDGCTRTQGYWKNHASGSKKPDPAWAKLMPDGENTTFFKSGETYHSIFDVQPKGNSYYSLAHQYVAAHLNNISGATMPTSVATAYNEAFEFLSDYEPNDVAASKTLKATATQLAGILDAYNNGVTGPGHCE